MTEFDFLKLKSTIRISSFGNEQYLITDEYESVNLTVNSLSKTLIELFDGTKTLNDVLNTYNKRTSLNLTLDNLTNIIQNSYFGYGIFEGDDTTTKIVVKDNYLKLRFIIFRLSWVRYIANLIKGLFLTVNFYSIIAITSVFLSYIFLTKISLSELYASLSPELLVQFYVINIISIVFHEFGHAGACECYGAKSGEIGFGFYLFTPVFYADVTDAWRLKRNERVIVDLGGIFMQLIFCSIMAIIFLVTGEKYLLKIAFLITTTILININPLLKFDGYWLLSDLTNIPNFREQADKRILLLSKSISNRKFEPNFLTSKNILLCVYGLISYAFMAYFISYMLFYRQDSILNFPVNLYHFFTNSITRFNTLTFLWIKQQIFILIIPFGFYMMLFNLIFKFIKNKKQKDEI